MAHTADSYNPKPHFNYGQCWHLFFSTQKATQLNVGTWDLNQSVSQEGGWYLNRVSEKEELVFWRRGLVVVVVYTISLVNTEFRL
jgi:hypothetical protein